MAGYPLAGVLRHSDPRSALAVYDHTLRHLAEIKSNPNVQFYQARALAGSSYPLRDLGRNGEARQRLDSAFHLLRELKCIRRMNLPWVRERTGRWPRKPSTKRPPLCGTRTPALPGIAGPDRGVQAGTGSKPGRRHGQVGHLCRHGGGRAAGRTRRARGPAGFAPPGALAALGEEASGECVCRASDGFDNIALA